MKAIVRKIDELGRFVLPKDIRKFMGITDGCSLEILTTDQGILLKKQHISELDLIDDIENLQRLIQEEASVIIGQDKAKKVQEHLQEAILLLQVRKDPDL